MSSINVKPLGTPAKEYLGAGAVFIGGDITDWATTPGTLLGTTKGGNAVTDGAEFRERQADADYMPIKGARDMTRQMNQLTVKSLTIDVASMEKYFAGIEATTGTTYDTLTRTFDISTSYQDRIYWIGQNREGKDLAIQLDNVLGDGPISWSTTKDEEIVTDVVWTAHADPTTFDITDKTTYPMQIFIEK